MITKFICKETYNSIEFQREENTLLISTQESEREENYLSVRLNKEELFSLVGQLLRIQSEIKKEVSNG